MTYLVLIGDVMVRGVIFWTIGEHSYFFNSYIISYLRIKVYRVKTMDMGRSNWKNSVSGKILLKQWWQWEDPAGTMVSVENTIVVSTMVLIVRYKILW